MLNVGEKRLRLGARMHEGVPERAPKSRGALLDLVMIDRPLIHAVAGYEELLSCAHSVGKHHGAPLVVLPLGDAEVGYEAVEVVDGTDEAVVARVPQDVVTAICVDFARDEAVEPPR